MVAFKDITGLNPVALVADRKEREIDHDLRTIWPIKRHYTFEMIATTVPNLLEVALELKRRYSEVGWKIQLAGKQDKDGRWYTANLEFVGGNV